MMPALVRAFRVIALALVLAWTGMSSAMAETGTPAGWSLTQASEHMRVGRIVLRYEPGLYEEAQALAREAPILWSQVEQVLAWDLDDMIDVTLVDHPGGVARSTGMPRWVAGVADPPTGTIAIARHAPDGSRTDLSRLLQHEMAHVALHRAVGGARVPRWFHEGVAQSIAEEIDLARAETLAGVVFGAGVPPLSELEANFHGDDHNVNVAYAAARDFVLFLRYEDGTGARFRQALTQLRGGHAFRAAFVRAYDTTLDDLDRRWRSGLLGRFVWFPLLGAGGLPFAVLAPLVLLAWLRRRRVIANAWARLDMEERELVFAPALDRRLANPGIG